MNERVAEHQPVHKRAAATTELVQPRAAPTRAAGHPVIPTDGVGRDFFLPVPFALLGAPSAGSLRQSCQGRTNCRATAEWQETRLSECCQRLDSSQK